MILHQQHFPAQERILEFTARSQSLSIDGVCLPISSIAQQVHQAVIEFRLAYRLGEIAQDTGLTAGPDLLIGTDRTEHTQADIGKVLVGLEGTGEGQTVHTGHMHIEDRQHGL